MAESKADLAYISIKNKILSGELKPLADISETNLIEELGFGRTPIREAFLRLTVEGFLVMYPNKGTVVSGMSKDQIEEIYDMRFLNEPFICKMAAVFLPKKRIEEMLALFIEAQNSADPPREYLMDLDRTMHMEFLNHCNNSFLITIMKNVYDHNERIRAMASDPMHDHSIEEHIDILKAMIARDEEQIYKTVMKHLKASKNIALSSFFINKVH